jgi:predicted ABC-type transport system involved in lysophospholipase L1 biosynthesis ATPase subunit
VRRCDSDCLYLDKLIGVTEDSDAEQRARHVMIAEGVGYLIPGSKEIVAVAACDVDSRLEHIPHHRARLLQGSMQVAERLAHLRSDVSGSNDSPVLIERAGTRSEDEIGRGSLGGVGIRGTGEEPGAADKFNGHGNRACQAGKSG